MHIHFAEALKTEVIADEFTLRSVKPLKELRDKGVSADVLAGIEALYAHENPEHRLVATILTAVISTGRPHFTLSEDPLITLVKGDPNNAGRKPEVKNAKNRCYELLRLKFATRIAAAQKRQKGCRGYAAAWILQDWLVNTLGMSQVGFDARTKSLLAFVGRAEDPQKAPPIVETEAETPHEPEVEPVVETATKTTPKNKRRQVDVEADEVDPGPSYDEPHYVDEDAPRKSKKSKQAERDSARFDALMEPEANDISAEDLFLAIRAQVPGLKKSMAMKVASKIHEKIQPFLVKNAPHILEDDFYGIVKAVNRILADGSKPPKVNTRRDFKTNGMVILVEGEQINVYDDHSDDSEIATLAFVQALFHRHPVLQVLNLKDVVTFTQPGRPTTQAAGDPKSNNSGFNINAFFKEFPDLSEVRHAGDENEFHDHDEYMEALFARKDAA